VVKGKGTIMVIKQEIVIYNCNKSGCGYNNRNNNNKNASSQISQQITSRNMLVDTISCNAVASPFGTYSTFVPVTYLYLQEVINLRGS